MPTLHGCRGRSEEPLAIHPAHLESRVLTAMSISYRTSHLPESTYIPSIASAPWTAANPVHVQRTTISAANHHPAQSNPPFATASHRYPLLHAEDLIRQRRSTPKSKMTIALQAHRAYFNNTYISGFTRSAPSCQDHAFVETTDVAPPNAQHPNHQLLMSAATEPTSLCRNSLTKYPLLPSLARATDCSCQSPVAARLIKTISNNC
jgi:hypothetical protein